MSELVSIITPAFNAALYIREAIDSVLAQDYAEWEMIVVDDASDDSTKDIVYSYKDERIIYHRMDIHSGIAHCRNYALRVARGRWIAFLDADDKWLPNKLSTQLFFMRNGNVAFSYTEYYECEENLNTIRRIVTGPKRIGKLGMYVFCWPGCLTVMYDRQQVGLVQIEEIEKNNDYAIWMKIVKRFDCELLRQPLAHYRRHDGSATYHPFWRMIVWHYRLFRKTDGRSRISSVFLTGVNLLGGVVKKFFYSRQVH